MTIEQIKDMPTTFKNVHESIYRSSATLDKVKEMMKRGDSYTTILEVLDVIYPKVVPQVIQSDYLPF